MQNKAKGEGKSRGCRIGVCDDWQDDRQFVEALLLDVEMGSMDGVELAKRVLQDDRTVGIVFITGCTDCIAEGAQNSEE